MCTVSFDDTHHITGGYEDRNQNLSLRRPLWCSNWLHTDRCRGRYQAWCLVHLQIGMLPFYEQIEDSVTSATMPVIISATANTSSNVLIINRFYFAVVHQLEIIVFKGIFFNFSKASRLNKSPIM